MSQKFTSISKGDLKKFDGRKARIVTRASGIEAEGAIFVYGGMVIFVTDKTGLEEDLDRADIIRKEYADGFDLYYQDDPDDLVTNHLVKEIEIL